MDYEITALNDQGMGICYVDNKITFVINTIVHDVVNIDIIEEHKKYNIAKVKKYISKSKMRVKEFCPYFEKCGGCSLQNISYEDTIKFKKDKLKNILHKFANINVDIDVVKSNQTLNYRNKITLKIKNKKIGYFAYNSNDLVEIEECLIANKNINKFIKVLNKFNIINGEIVIRNNYNDELLIHILSDDKITIPNLNDFKVVGILQNNKLIYGEDHFIEIINNKYFQVSYDSFFQINRDITSKIFDYIRNNILKEKNVLDLYCGVGTLGINIADISNKVYGIEVIKNAVLNAILNSKINKVNNTKYMLGDVKEIIDKISDKIDVIIIDPPRSGLSKKEIESILKINPKQIIYVSCDPITLARDLKLLNINYKIDNIVGFDMFSYTYHIETVTIMSHI